MAAAGVTRRRRPWVWPAIILVAALVTGGAVIGVRTLLRDTPDLFPPDGTAAAVTVAGVPGGMLEQSVLTPDAVARLGRLGEIATAANPDIVRWLRVTVAPAPTPTTLLITDDGGPRLAGVELPDGGLTFAPALELAAAGEAAAAGQSGKAATLLGEQPYEATVGSSEVDDCATTEADLTAPEPLGATHLTITVCVGRGVTDLVFVSDVAGLEVHPDAAPPAAGDLDLTSAAVALSDPADWRPHDRDTYVDGGFGPQLLRADGLVEPVPLRSGRIAALDPLTGDVLVLARPTAPGLVRLDWRSHPGGTVTQLAGSGELVVVATSTGRVVGFGPDGVRVWSRELAGQPVALGLTDDGLVCALQDGNLVRLDPQSGAEVERVALGVRLAPPGVVVANLVVVRTGDALVAYGVTTGVQSWTRPVTEPLDVAADEVTVAVAAAAATTALAAADGRVRWEAGGGNLVVAADGRVLIAAGAEVSLLGVQGVTETWTLDAPVSGAVATPAGVVLTTGDGVTWLG